VTTLPLPVPIAAASCDGIALSQIGLEQRNDLLDCRAGSN
jgi:hypothetical protein